MNAREYSEISGADLSNDNCIFSGELTAKINNLGLGVSNYNADGSVASVTEKKASEMLNHYIPLMATQYGNVTQINQKDLMQASGLTTLLSSMYSLSANAMKRGITEFNINFTYQKGSLVKELDSNNLPTGRVFVSLTNNNIGNLLTDTTNWKLFYNTDLDDSVKMSFVGTWESDGSLTLTAFNSDETTITQTPRFGSTYAVYCVSGNTNSTNNVVINFKNGLQNQSLKTSKGTTIPAGELKGTFSIMYSNGGFVIQGGQISNIEYGEDTSRTGLKIYTQKKYVDYDKTYGVEEVLIDNSIFTSNYYYYNTKLLFSTYTNISATTIGMNGVHPDYPTLISVGNKRTGGGVITNQFVDPTTHIIGIVTALWDSDGGGTGTSKVYLRAGGWL